MRTIFRYTLLENHFQTKEVAFPNSQLSWNASVCESIHCEYASTCMCNVEGATAKAELKDLFEQSALGVTLS